MRLSTAIDRVEVHPCVDKVYATALANVNVLVRNFETSLEEACDDVDEAVTWFTEFETESDKLKNRIDLFTADENAADEYRSALADCETVDQAKSVLADIIAKFEALDAERKELKTDLAALFDDGPPDIADQLYRIRSLIETAGDS